MRKKINLWTALITTAAGTLIFLALIGGIIFCLGWIIKMMR